ncbi:hypothetical protein DL93DRAFT_2153235 [Clavulina sp. PMI_390]|nr:hypothetical protein DL93DRAFT_2153235 [Clavulina sp. PMI_390]
MHTLLRLAVLLALVFPILCDAWPLLSRDSSLQTVFQSVQEETPPLRIAIIGAGAGGSSAAFWISKASARHGRAVIVDVYEQADYVGGRSTAVYPHNNKSLDAIELGAYGLADFDRNMMRAAKEFNITLSNANDMRNNLGIWNGRKILTQLSYLGLESWLNRWKLVWRYGFSLPQWDPTWIWEAIDKFYSPYLSRFIDHETYISQARFTPLFFQTFSEHLLKNGFGKLLVHEVIGSVIRSNHGQSVDEINALMGAVIMRQAIGHSIVAGGASKAFEQFLNRSSASVYLNTKVTGIRLVSTNSKVKWSLSVEHDRPKLDIPAYDHVIIAAPFGPSGITILDSPKIEAEILMPPVEYIRRHVTVFTTLAAQPNPVYFNLPAGADIPTFVTTTVDGSRPNRIMANGVMELPEPEFNSLKYLYQTKALNEHGVDEWAVRISSKDTISDEWLARVFGEGMVTWVDRKQWDAYPKTKPMLFPPLNPGDGLWYINAFEPFMSTMETQTIASRNIVDTIFRIEFADGICPIRPTAKQVRCAGFGAGAECEDVLKPASDGKGAEGRLYGWDC